MFSRKPSFRHWASENFGSVVARSRQAVAEAFSASGCEIHDRNVRIQFLHGPQVCYAQRLVRVAGGRPIHRSADSVTQTPTVPRSTVSHVPEQDELTGVVDQNAPPRSSERANLFLANYTPYGSKGVVPCVFGTHVLEPGELSSGSLVATLSSCILCTYLIPLLPKTGAPVCRKDLRFLPIPFCLY